MSGDLMAVIEQILDDGYLSTETLAQLRAAYQQSGPQSGYSRDLPVTPADGQDYGHLAGDKPAPARRVQKYASIPGTNVRCRIEEPTRASMEDAIKYGSAWSLDGNRLDPMLAYKNPRFDALREAARMGLEALEQDNPAGRTATIAALREALGDRT